jgi:hypothetical protein
MICKFYHFLKNTYACMPAGSDIVGDTLVDDEDVNIGEGKTSKLFNGHSVAYLVVYGASDIQICDMWHGNMSSL